MLTLHHLNVSGASSGQILSWNGSDYAWVSDQVGVTTANINADTLNVSGVSTFAGITTVTGQLQEPLFQSS